MDWVIHRDDVFDDREAATLWVTGESIVHGSVDITAQPHKSIFTTMQRLKEAAESGRVTAIRREPFTTLINNQPIQSFKYYFRAEDLLTFAKSRGAVPEFLIHLEAKDSEFPQSEKPLTTTERNTLLTIVAALCDYSHIDPASRGAAGQIAKLTEEFGAPVTDDTILKWLKLIPDALASRKK